MVAMHTGNYGRRPNSLRTAKASRFPRTDPRSRRPAFTPAEHHLGIGAHAARGTPGQRAAYNTEAKGETAHFRGVVRTGTAHCLEAALAAAAILEQHRYPPLVLSFESIDLLDHVIFVYQTSSGWGSVARSRDPGLHGRKPLFATPRALALSYAEAYSDSPAVSKPRSSISACSGPMIGGCIKNVEGGDSC